MKQSTPGMRHGGNPIFGVFASYTHITWYPLQATCHANIYVDRSTATGAVNRLAYAE